MSDLRATRGHWLGLSVGATNLAGTRDGQSAVVRPAEISVRGHRLTGFVDRVGDPVPLVAHDGSRHHPERLLAGALDATAQAATDGKPVADTAIAVPAHWPAPMVDALRRCLPDGLPVISDVIAALTALRANPGLPTNGVIVLCDFGGSGTSITLADAGADLARIGETVRLPDFSGDQIDQALLRHVVAGLGEAAHADPSGTAMVGSLVRLREECRSAKERLSAETATAIGADLPGRRVDIRVTRTELEDLLAAPLAAFIAALDDTLRHTGVPAAGVTAVATIGGGARIPLVTLRLSEHLRAPVVTTPHPQLTAAEGAALAAQRGQIVDVPTTVTPTPGIAVPTAITLAWSDETEATGFYEQPADGRPEVVFGHQEWQESEETPRRAPLVLFGLSALAAAIAATVFGITLLSDTTTTPVEAATAATDTSTLSTAPSTISPAPAASAPLPTPPAPQASHVTTVVVQQPVTRFTPAPRPWTQAPVTTQAPPPPAPEPPTADPMPPPWTPPVWTSPWTPPPWTPPWEAPKTPQDPPVPPIDPGAGNGESGTGSGSPPIDPGTGGSSKETGTGNADAGPAPGT